MILDLGSYVNYLYDSEVTFGVNFVQSQEAWVKSKNAKKNGLSRLQVQKTLLYSYFLVCIPHHRGSGSSFRAWYQGQFLSLHSISMDGSGAPSDSH